MGLEGKILMYIIAIDPGEHIGVVMHDTNVKLTFGVTLEGETRNQQLFTLLMKLKPEIVIFEQFALRPGTAMKLVGSKFITCEVIGVIKLYCQLNSCRIVELLPVNKEYCGFSSKPNDPNYSSIDMLGKRITEHVRDAYRLYNYARLFKKIE